MTRCLEAAEQAREEARVAAVAVQLKLERIEATRSWRLTAPLRAAMRRVRRLLRR